LLLIRLLLLLLALLLIRLLLLGLLLVCLLGALSTWLPLSCPLAAALSM
jgi:hypothetical protein